MKPVFEILELFSDELSVRSFLQGNHEDDTLHVTVVDLDEGPIDLLPRRVPQLQMNFLVFDGYYVTARWKIRTVYWSIFRDQ